MKSKPTPDPEEVRAHLAFIGAAKGGKAVDDDDKLRAWANEFSGNKQLHDYIIDAELAECVRAHLHLLDDRACEIIGYHSVELSLVWFDVGPLAFMRAVKEVLDP